ncbi:helix-turn-helix domain-containing protein [Sulfolobus tengchongensis]|uniref:Helix-turn-helix domain-containing protein n=1 Tax=Sulfolobus tengchongensis TaxID=207809 RepID=A0AAX4KY26_9CREN
MHVFKMKLGLKHDACWTYKTSDFNVNAEVKYLFPLITKNSIFEIAEIYSNDKNDLSDFIATVSRKFGNNIRVVNIDRPRSSKAALLYYFKNFDNSVTKVMIENNAVITNLLIGNGIEEWYAYFFGEEDEVISNLSNDLKKIDVKIENIDVERSKVNEIKNDLMILNSLTPTEREILSAAIKLGFFEYPKKVRLEELAEMFGVTKVTLDRHIRNGLRKILSQLFINS